MNRKHLLSMSPLALLVLLANLSWGSTVFTYLPNPGSVFAGCTVAGGLYHPEGMVPLPNGQILVSTFAGTFGDGLYVFNMPSNLTTCPTPGGLTRLSSVRVRGMAMTMDGRIYGNGPGGALVEVNPNDGSVSVRLAGVNGLGMALDPVSGNLFVTVNGALGSAPQVVQISGLPGNPVATTFATLSLNGTIGSTADGLAWSCDGRYLLVADLGDRVWRVDRGNGNSLAILSFPAGTRPDGIAFGAPGTALGGHAYTNTNDGHIYQFNYVGTNPHVIAIAENGGDGDFVTVDKFGNLLTTHATSIDAVYWKQGQGTGGYILAGSSLCQSLQCAAAAAQFSNCLSGENALTVNALATAACSASNCGGCSTVNLELSAALTVMNNLNHDGCLNPAITAANTLYNQCPCNPLACTVPCDPANGCGGSPPFILQSSGWLER